MDHSDHVALIRGGVPAGDRGRWADLGSGTGAFTLALADLLGPGGRIVSVDRDAGALEQQRRAMAEHFPEAAVDYRVADMLAPLGPPPLDGAVMANSLHFQRDRPAAVDHVRGLIRPGGRLILVEYDVDRGNPWVPYPLSFATWQRMAVDCGFSQPVLLGRVPSRWLGAIYSALAELPAS
jgi:SAM-dependent methyltransferase